MNQEEDDRALALAWYFRMLVRQEYERGTERKDLLAKLKIGKGHLSQIERGTLGIGVPKLIQFAPVFGFTPGELLDRALSRWESVGRGEYVAHLQSIADRAAGSATESGEHKSVAPPDEAKPRRKVAK